MNLINGQPGNQINITDRGLQYGDGLFETMAYIQGEVQLLSLHLARLKDGCDRLGIAIDLQALQQDLSVVLSQQSDDCVIKIIVTRGAGGRGYKASPDMPATRIISAHPLPDYPEHCQTGIRACLCHIPVGSNPALAGIKHLNRLEQVLARNEWQDDSIREGLMFDMQGTLIEGTMSNVFLGKNGSLYTPDLQHSGVAGIMRQYLIETASQQQIDCHQKILTKADLLAADELFVCNSLIGIWPVTELVDQRFYNYGELTQQLQYHIKGVHV